jgi:hypothetical protein
MSERGDSGKGGRARLRPAKALSVLYKYDEPMQKPSASQGQSNNAAVVFKGLLLSYRLSATFLRIVNLLAAGKQHSSACG